MRLDEVVRSWARSAKRGDRMIILAEADGQGNAAWGEVRLTAQFAAEPIAWGVAADMAEDALAAVKARPAGR